MEDKDLKQIQELFRKEFKDGFKQGFSDIWEGNLEPAFNDIYQKFDDIDRRFDKQDDKIAQLPTKAYLDDKIANLQGDLITKLHKEDDKLNRLANILRQKNVISESDLTELGDLVVFPK